MKHCPKCNLQHDKNGKFCSRKCANSRTWTDEDKKKKSDSVKNFYKTDEGIIHKKVLSLKATMQTHSEETKSKIGASVSKLWDEEKRLAQSILMTGKPFSPETRKKLSDIATARGFGGTTSKKRMYFKKNNGEVVYLQSSYEIRFAEILERLNIEWTRPEPLIWVDTNGKSHKYYPDFKVGSIFVDTKNDYLAIQDLPKINAVREQNNIDLRVVTNGMITEQYVASLV